MHLCFLSYLPSRSRQRVYYSTRTSNNDNVNSSSSLFLNDDEFFDDDGGGSEGPLYSKESQPVIDVDNAGGNAVDNTVGDAVDDDSNFDIAVDRAVDHAVDIDNNALTKPIPNLLKPLADAPDGDDAALPDA